MKKLSLFILLIIFPFIVIALPVGDVDGDGYVKSNDYILVRKHILKNPVLTGDKLTRANVDGKSGVNSADYIAIRKIIMGGGSSATPTPAPTPAPTPVPTPTSTPVPTPAPYVISSDTSIDSRMKALFGSVTEVASCTSSTLSYRVLKSKDTYYNSDQYIALIWAKDPANQLNSALASYTSGYVIANSSNILKNEKNKYFSDKDGCMIAVNGSFFSQKSGSYTQGSYKPLVINRGKLIYDGTKSGNQYGKLAISKDGTLSYIRHNTPQEFINDGVINTWDISHSRTVKNEGNEYFYRNYAIGEWVSIAKPCKTSSGYCSNRTIIGQDSSKNNFVIVSGYGPHDLLMGYAYQVTDGKIKTYHNLDGSGSRRLYVHKAGGSVPGDLLTNGDGRYIADLLYFSEHTPNK